MTNFHNQNREARRPVGIGGGVQMGGGLVLVRLGMPTRRVGQRYERGRGQAQRPLPTFPPPLVPAMIGLPILVVKIPYQKNLTRHVIASGLVLYGTSGSIWEQVHCSLFSLC
jgi:hypothetical protein